MTQYSYNPQFRKRLEYALICWLLLIGVVGPLLQTLDDDENLGLFASSDPGRISRALPKPVAHTAPGIVVGAICCASLRSFVAMPEPVIASVPQIPAHAVLALLAFPLRH